MMPRMCIGVCLLVGFFARAAAAGSPPAHDDLPRFSVRPIGGLDFGDLRITAVNDRGSAAGVSISRTGDHFRYTALFRDRGGDRQTIASDDLLTVVDMNERDWVVGSTTAGAFAWNERDGLIRLGSLGGRASYADGINDHNQVVGFTDTVGGERRAFLWDQDGGMRTLPVPVGSGTSTAHDISNKGTIAGHTYLRGGGMQHANIWTGDGRFVDLGELPGGH
jgi:probable HAF family extracellular repeat protein